ncbi:MAG: dihydrolipoamide acetyltransferase family protein [Pseudomonadota bacterium]
MSDFLMPSLGGEMTSGKLVEWKVSPGDRVEKGQVIATVETAKAAMDVEVFETGVIEELYVAEDTDVEVGTPLARIGVGRELHEPPREEGPEAPPETPEAVAVAGIIASPAARRQARETGVSLAGLQGSGPDGAVVLRDLPRASGTRSAVGAGFEPEPMRQAIAAAMSRSKREIPHYYLATTVDLHRAECWLSDYNAHKPPEDRLLMSALFIKAAALSLACYSELNGHYGDDGFVAATHVNLGVAVHLRGGGLLAPAIPDANTLTLAELMHRLQDLVRRARGGGLRASEMAGGTATVTALGDRGVDTVYGVIYPPQVAMIGIGRVRRRPLAVDDGIALRLAVDLSLAADHRVCDGHRGALFLNEMEQRLQAPEAL